jgi:hypothetical protein
MRQRTNGDGVHTFMLTQVLAHRPLIGWVNRQTAPLDFIDDNRAEAKMGKAACL